MRVDWRVDWLTEIEVAEYAFIAGDEGTPGSLVVRDEAGDTIVADVRCTVLAEVESRAAAVEAAREWADAGDVHPDPGVMR